jgi:hypothetical protein
MPAGARPDARRRLDAAVRGVLAMPDADCPEVWASVQLARGEGGFADRVRAELGRGTGGEV